MRKNLALLLVVLIACGYVGMAQQGNLWTPVSESTIARNVFANRVKPDAYQLYRLNESSLTTVLRNAPSEKVVNVSRSSFILSVPTPSGRMESFTVVEAPVMDPALAARYPDIKAYAGQGIDDPGSSIRFDVSPRGFHGMILSSERPTIYIDPVDRSSQSYVVFARNEVVNYRKTFQCFTQHNGVAAPPAGTGATNPAILRNADDGRLRAYRLALASTGEYSQYFLDGTETTDAQRKAKVLAAMNTMMVRTNAIYERDFGVRMTLIANNDAIIYLNASTDPWTTEYNTKTQQTIDAVIGNAGYDIGHLVHRGSNNGNAGCIGCVCRTGQKGSAFTSHTTPEGDPFVVDYTTHEMGHQFGANHTFSFQTEGTGVNMEPGSGSTIMGYAGITGATTDVQPHSDDYFHCKSIEQVTNYIKGTVGGGCAVVTVTGNTTPTASAGTDFTIPKSTPFALTGTSADADAGDVLTHAWEQIDNYASGSATVPSATSTTGPQFRSVNYTAGKTRSFPNHASILGGTNGNKWEVLPSVARSLNFRFTARDNHAGGGNNRSDDMLVTVSNAGPFAVTAPNTAVTWAPSSAQTVTWSVNGTNAAPVNTANVKISLSTDGGNTFPIVILASTPNDGSESITVPNNPSSTARIKIEAVGNIYFDISNVNFSISGTPPVCSNPAGLNATSVTTTTATVGWSAVLGANNYDVDYKAASSSTWINAATGTTATSVNLSSLTAATLYDWRVRANCTSGSSSYSAAQFTTQNTPPGCNNAYEPNETLAAAATVATNTAISAAITSATDKDWYKFTLSGTGNLSITLGNLPGDYDIILYNASGTELARSENGGTSSETINYNNAAAGTYHIQVFGYNGAFSTTVCYNMNIGTTITTCPSTFDNSTNGNFAGAVSIPFNTNVTGLISPSGDLDFYKFVITTGGTITITLTNLPADYDLQLFNSSQTQVAISQAGGSSSETINYTAAAGTYYVRVYGYQNANNASVCYNLRVATGTASKKVEPITALGGSTITIYPNPVQSTLKVNLINVPTASVVKVIDVNGRVLINQPGVQGGTSLDVQRFSQGVYMIVVTDEKGKVRFQSKFLKD